jgi:endoglucanase
VGFVVTRITPAGLIRFSPLGGWWSQVLLGQRVVVLTERGPVHGVIAVPSPHGFLVQEIDLSVSDEAFKLVRLQQMSIDVGALSVDEVRELGISEGDPIVPDSGVRTLANGSAFLSKAWDDRAGLVLLLDIMGRLAQTQHPNTIVAVATVQEELGTRGAQAVVEKVAPDVALIVECALAEAEAIPGIEPPQAGLGGGPVLSVMDFMMVPNIKLRRWVEKTARESGIALQHCASEGGGSDGGPFHTHSGGVPSLVIGLPMRYAHSWAGIIRRDDYQRTLDLWVQVVSRLDSQALASFK